MNKKLIIGVAVAIIVILGLFFFFTRDKHVPFNGIEPKVFSDPEFGITFSHPEDFQINATKIPKKNVMIKGNQETEPAILNVTLIKDETLFLLAVNNHDIGFDDFPPPGKDDLVVDDHHVLAQSYEDKEAGQDIFVYYIEDNDNQFYWMARIKTGDLESKTIFNDIVKSMKFTAPPPAPEE